MSLSVHSSDQSSFCSFTLTNLFPTHNYLPFNVIKKTYNISLSRLITMCREEKWGQEAALGSGRSDSVLSLTFCLKCYIIFTGSTILFATDKHWKVPQFLLYFLFLSSLNEHRRRGHVLRSAHTHDYISESAQEVDKDDKSGSQCGWNTLTLFLSVLKLRAGTWPGFWSSSSSVFLHSTQLTAHELTWPQHHIPQLQQDQRGKPGVRLWPFFPCFLFLCECVNVWEEPSHVRKWPRWLPFLRETQPWSGVVCSN